MTGMAHQYESEPVRPKRDTHTVGAPKLVLGDAPQKGMLGQGLDSNTTYELHRGQAPQAVKEPAYTSTPAHTSQAATQPASRDASYSSFTRDPSHLTPSYNVSGSTTPSGIAPSCVFVVVQCTYGSRLLLAQSEHQQCGQHRDTVCVHTLCPALP